MIDRRDAIFASVRSADGERNKGRDVQMLANIASHSVTKITPSLLIAQGFEGVDAGGSPGGEVAGEESDNGQHERDAGEG